MSVCVCGGGGYGYKLMSQDSREKFGVKSQMRGGGGGGEGGGEKREKGYVESRTK